MYHLKFYADCPDNQKNKLFCYPVHDGKHAADLLARFAAKSFRLRAAFLGRRGALCAALPTAVIKFPSSVATASALLLDFPPLPNALHQLPAAA
jgi:hypothetical protein